MKGKGEYLLLACLIFSPFSLTAQEKPAVSLYGIVHLGLDLLHDGASSGLNLSSNSSRLGFRGGLDLAKGLKAVFQVEQEIQWDNGSGAFASRDTFLGLTGRFGTLRLGYFDTPLKVIRSRTDLFGDQIGDGRNLTRLKDVWGSAYDFDSRFRNGVHYRSPSVSGLVLDLHYATHTDSGVNPPGSGRDAVSISLTYSKEKWYLAGAWEFKNDSDSSALRFGAWVNLAPFRICGLVQLARIKKEGEAESQGIQTFGLGTACAVSDRFSLKGQLYLLRADLADRDATMLALGLDYRHNKAFQVLLAYAVTANGDRVQYSMAAGGHGAQLYPALPGLSVRGLSASLRYGF